MRAIQDKATDHIQAELVKCTVALELGLKPEELQSKNKGNHKVILARQLSMYLANSVYHMNLAHVGRLFHRARSTVEHACGVIEDCRDDPVMDDRIERLEAFLRLSPVPVGQR